MILINSSLDYTVSHSSPSRFTMLALAEEDFCGSTPSLFLQIYNKMAARRKTISPTRPSIAGTFIVFLCILLWCRTFSLFRLYDVPFCSFNLLWPKQSLSVVDQKLNKLSLFTVTNLWRLNHNETWQTSKTRDQ